jgi:hypothetical protein
VRRASLTLPSCEAADYVTLAVGSVLALFLYPHTGEFVILKIRTCSWNEAP